MREFFIMLDSPFESCITAIVEADGETVMIFPTLEKAHNLAKEHSACRANGYEIFERGSGEQ